MYVCMRTCIYIYVYVCRGVYIYIYIYIYCVYIWGMPIHSQHFAPVLLFYILIKDVA